MELKELKTPSDFKIITAFYMSMPYYSDFSPMSIMCWKHDKRAFYYIGSDYYVLKMPSYLGRGYTYTFYLKRLDINLLNELKSLNTVYKYVPKETVNIIKDTSKTVCELDRDSFDYIYCTKDLVTPANIENRKKMQKFTSANPSVNTRLIDFKNVNEVKNIFHLTEEWCVNKGLSATDMQNELNATETYIKFSTLINDISVGLYIHDVLVAFTFNEKVSDKHAIGHFGKSSYSVKYSSYASEVYTAQLLLKRGIEYINNQQDTGILSLRDYKESLVPETYLEKYTVTFK